MFKTSSFNVKLLQIYYAFFLFVEKKTILRRSSFNDTAFIYNTRCNGSYVMSKWLWGWVKCKRYTKMMF